MASCISLSTYKFNELNIYVASLLNSLTYRLLHADPCLVNQSLNNYIMKIDITFNVYTDANGGDPDNTSPTLRRYHKILWSKPLPNGQFFQLDNNKCGAYLFHKSEFGEFILGSDAITHSYKYQKRKEWLVSQIPKDVDELFDIGSTIGAFTVFPQNKIDNKFTINQARGVNSRIDDRFDLTLECIRLFY